MLDILISHIRYRFAYMIWPMIYSLIHSTVCILLQTFTGEDLIGQEGLDVGTWSNAVNWIIIVQFVLILAFLIGDVLLKITENLIKFFTKCCCKEHIFEKKRKISDTSNESIAVEKSATELHEMDHVANEIIDDNEKSN